MIDVRLGLVEPAVAGAIATLAKTSVALAHDMEIEDRLAALEEAAGISPPNVTRLDRRRA